MIYINRYIKSHRSTQKRKGSLSDIPELLKDFQVAITVMKRPLHKGKFNKSFPRNRYKFFKSLNNNTDTDSKDAPTTTSSAQIQYSHFRLTTLLPNSTLISKT